MFVPKAVSIRLACGVSRRSERLEAISRAVLVSVWANIVFT